MPDMIRAGTLSLRAASWRGLSAALAALLGIATGALGVLARDLGPPASIALAPGDFAPPDRHEVAVVALLLGVISFAVVTAILLVQTRVRAAQTAGAARQEITALREQLDRAHALLLSEPQLLIAWAPAAEDPHVFGDVGVLSANTTPRRALAFGTWLDPEQAQTMERAVEALRSHGESFALMVTTLSGRPIEASGRAVGGRAVLRLRDVSGTERELVDLSALHADLEREVQGLRALIEALPTPIWAREDGGRIVWVNSAFAHAVEAHDGADAVKRHLELLSPSARHALATARRAGETYAARLPVIVAGRRRIFDVLDVPTRHGSAGIGIDVTDVETLRSELTRMVEAHRRTLDQLPTAVAIFGADQRLTFHNAAYRVLWGLGADFLDARPTDGAVLDQLRAARKLPEQADFRVWKSALHEAYRTIEAKEHLWHLPDGRTLRVVTTSNPNGGITYLFDDVTEPLNLKRRYDALARVQGETLDNLSEAVAVFASDGRLRLFNPALIRLWKLAPTFLSERPHIEAVIAACRPLHNDEATWQLLRGAVTGLEHRAPITRRIERSDATLVDCATVPLPDGATLVTFQDVTDTVNVERALRERNDALEAAYDLKNDFVHLVSYELRSPLTNIIGFAQLLEDRLTGPLTDKQREYLGYITSSSAALLAIINDILDLATIDAGVMTLDLGSVDIAATMDAAADAVRDRLNEGGLTLEIGADPQIGQFVADGRRVRQVLYNLLSNAIGFSPPGETVTLAAERRHDAVLFRVTDRGPGIPIEIQDRVFDRFETHNLGSRHRGTGLGLSIVRSFVELHGGTVSLDSAVGRGTTVICVFPQVQVAERAAAE
jgi:signal transduction histidine kinase